MKERKVGIESTLGDPQLMMEMKFRGYRIM